MNECRACKHKYAITHVINDMLPPFNNSLRRLLQNFRACFLRPGFHFSFSNCPHVEACKRDLLPANNQFHNLHEIGFSARK